jgi:hypothetical protein
VAGSDEAKAVATKKKLDEDPYVHVRKTEDAQDLHGHMAMVEWCVMPH